MFICRLFFFQMIDPMGISNWSVTYVDWSERRWHPKTYGANEISLEFMKNVTVCFKIQFLENCHSQHLNILLSFLACAVRGHECTRHQRGRGMPLWLSLAASIFFFSRFNTFTCAWKHGDELHWPCTWNGITRPCYLFARKFHPDTLDTLVNLFPNYTSTAAWERILEPKHTILGPNYVPDMSQRYCKFSEKLKLFLEFDVSLWNWKPSYMQLEHKILVIRVPFCDFPAGSVVIYWFMLHGIVLT